MLAVGRSAATLARHPVLWPTALRQATRMVRPGWWRRPPFLPLPDPEYLRFRLETHYGSGPEVEVNPHDLTTYLTWCREQHRRARTSR